MKECRLIEVMKYQRDILAPGETRWGGRGTKGIKGYEVVYFCVESVGARLSMVIQWWRK